MTDISVHIRLNNKSHFEWIYFAGYLAGLFLCGMTGSQVIFLTYLKIR
jgi:hypothetical protein